MESGALREAYHHFYKPITLRCHMSLMFSEHVTRRHPSDVWRNIQSRDCEPLMRDVASHGYGHEYQGRTLLPTPWIPVMSMCSGAHTMSKRTPEESASRVSAQTIWTNSCLDFEDSAPWWRWPRHVTEAGSSEAASSCCSRIRHLSTNTTQVGAEEPRA